MVERKRLDEAQQAIERKIDQILQRTTDDTERLFDLMELWSELLDHRRGFGERGSLSARKQLELQCDTVQAALQKILNQKE